MKKYLNIILFSAILLLIFPLLSFPQLWENIYVSILAFIVAYVAMLIHHKVVSPNEKDEETSLQDYVKELKERFKKHSQIENEGNNTKRISDITIDDK